MLVRLIYHVRLASSLWRCTYSSARLAWSSRTYVANESTDWQAEIKRSEIICMSPILMGASRVETSLIHSVTGGDEPIPPFDGPSVRHACSLHIVIQNEGAAGHRPSFDPRSPPLLPAACYTLIRSGRASAVVNLGRGRVKRSPVAEINRHRRWAKWRHLKSAAILTYSVAWSFIWSLHGTGTGSTSGTEQLHNGEKTDIV